VPWKLIGTHECIETAVIHIHTKQVGQRTEKVGRYRAGEGDNARQYNMREPSASQAPELGGGEFILKRRQNMV